MTRTVAIDGPAGAGKSTLARLLAEHLGVERLDTGAMYRAVAWAVLRAGLDPAAGEAVASLCRGLRIEVADRVLVDGVDATEGIRGADVDATVSVVAANPAVRAELVGRQRAWVDARGGGVLEGRDIGTVVLPGADLKVYLTASPGERAQRRAGERRDGRSAEEIGAQLAARDRIDSSRRDSPLPTVEDAAADALVIDSTGLDAQAVLQEVLACL